MSPDFSAYVDMDKAEIIHNIYKSRIVGRKWQQYGIKVIPTIIWAKPNTYDISFMGIEQNSIVAISTYGAVKNKNFFLQGYKEMQKRLKPKTVICIGNKLKEIDEGNLIFVKARDTYFMNSKNDNQPNLFDD